jgi:multidrug efflux pump subunit AcrA (membrane-fusion protein)
LALCAALCAAGLAAAVPARAAEPGAIGALGTLQPGSGLVPLNGRAGEVIAAIPVAVGDVVAAGAVIASYADRDRLELDVRQIRAELEELEGNGARDLTTQDLAVAKAREDQKRAEASLSNYRQISANAQVASVRAERENAVADARHGVRSALAARDKIETRTRLARTLIQLRLERAEMNLKGADLRAPFAGTVIEIHKGVGEAAGGPVLTLADLSRMQVACDVYEGDLSRVAVGRPATVTAKALAKPLSGKVARLGRRINADSKVAKVWIDLDAPEPAAHYIGMEVNVSIVP